MLLSAKIGLLHESPQGPIIRIAFAGICPPGSEGNDHAVEMRQMVVEAVSSHDPAGVVFDLTELQYTWGDAICGIAWALHKASGEFIPSSIVARGRTAKALRGLFSFQSIFVIAKTELLDDEVAALDHIRQRLTDETA